MSNHQEMLQAIHDISLFLEKFADVIKRLQNRRALASLHSGREEPVRSGKKSPHERTE